MILATLKDVAQAAGISMMTVSRVINAPDRVKPATRELVEKAIQEVGYIQNPAARALANKRLGVIDVYIPEHIDLSNSFAMHLIAGISDVLSAYLYSFLILRSREVSHPCDGYIVMGLFKDEVDGMAEYAGSRNCPMVLFGHTPRKDIDCIDVDNVQGTYELTRHLIAQGHRRIAMLNVAEEKDYTYDRLAGYRKALRETGLPFRPGWVVSAANHEDQGFEAAQALLAASGEVTALVCASDVLALGAVRAAKTLGIQVPQELSVTGFDGLGYHLLTEPKIFTARQPVYDVGCQLASLLLQRLSGEALDTVKRLVSPELIPGGSVAAPRAAVTISQKEELP